MQYHYIPKTGLQVSSLCLGTMTFGAEADASEAKKMFDLAKECGINFFDTADVYAKGASEKILGELIKGCREQVVISSKAYFPVSKDPNGKGMSRYHLIQSVESSLRRLQTDHLDIFYLHRFDDNMPLEEALRGVEYLVQAGKILYPAVSNYAAWQILKALGIAERNKWMPICAIQPMYNLVKRQAEVEILPAAQEEGVAVFPYNPLAGGLLSGKYFASGSDKAQDSSRLNATEMYKTRYMTDTAIASAEKFVALAKNLGFSPVQLAIAWVASHPAVTAPLVGARNCQQLQECIGALDIVMTPELRTEISSLSYEPPLATDRNEEKTSARFESITAGP
ncbi:MAG: aldo/keto reductase [Bdellovibrionota bacterium]